MDSVFNVFNYVPILFAVIVVLMLAASAVRILPEYERGVPLITYENKLCGLMATKALLAEGGIIASEMPRAPLQPRNLRRARKTRRARRARQARRLVRPLQHPSPAAAHPRHRPARRQRALAPQPCQR